MKKAIIPLVFILTLFQFALAQTPVLGTYSNTTVSTASGNTTVTPSTVPVNATSITAYTSGNFKGLLHVNTATGVVSVTDAHPSGNYAITVKAFNGAISVTTSFTLNVNNSQCSQGLFSVSADLSTAYPGSVAVGDFNSDGKQDFAVANSIGNNVSIRLGDGAGAFTGTTFVPVGNRPLSIAIGDFNGDGKQDFASANYDNNNVSVRLGDGIGGFTSSANVSVGSNPYAMAVTDFNNDGRQDLAVVNLYSYTVSIRLGNGIGGFSGTTNISVGTNPLSVAVGDFNNDGNQDFAAVNQVSRTVSIRLGNGAGGFTGTTNVPVEINPWQVCLGDFNGDGKLDFAATNWGSGTVSIRLGDGAGNFSGATNLPVGSYPIAIATGDFNGDGKLDFAAGGESGYGIAIRLGDGSGGFSASANVVAGDTHNRIAVGDFNSDGMQDFLVSNGNSDNVSVRLGRPGFVDINLQGNNSNIIDGDNTPGTGDHTDFTYNLVRTFIIQNLGEDSLRVSNIGLSGIDPLSFSISGIVLPATLGPGASSSFKIKFTPTSAGIKNATVIINNNDCDEAEYDFAIQGTAIVPSLGTYANAVVNTAGGNATVSSSFAPSDAASVTAYTSTNFKGLLHVNLATGTVTVTNAHPAGIYNVTVKAINAFSTAISNFTVTVGNTNCSQGAFEGTTNLAVGSVPKKLAVGDFNNDGKQDFAVSNYNNNNVSIRLGNGAGGFAGSTNINVGSTPEGVSIGDFNGDGNQDFVAANYNGSSVSIRLGDGLGGFNGNTEVPSETGPVSIGIGDFNNDGKQDLVIANFIAGNVSVRLGDGAGGFMGTGIIAVQSSPLFIVVGEFNGDGKQDFATSGTNGTVSIRLGDGLGNFTGTTNIAVDGYPISIALGDFNNDGKQDFATTNYNNSGIVSIRFGDGVGGFSGFTGTSEVSVGSNPAAIAAGDFNGDGNQDFATANYTNNSISIRLGNGTGGFTLLSNVGIESGSSSLAIGDFDSNGKLDIVTANSGNNSISIRLGGENDINIRGNNSTITDGDSTPSINDNSDFSKTLVGNNIVKTFVIQNIGIGILNVSNISIVGTDASSFTLTGFTLPFGLISGASTSFTITFNSVIAGVKAASVNITGNDCDESLYDFAIQATALDLPVLGTYPPTIITTAGGNSKVIPSAAPTTSTTLNAYTSSNFKGQLFVDPVTGVLSIINAHPAGSYNVTVGVSSATTSFTLTVGNTNCSQALFTANSNLTVGINPRSVAVGDFNGDGKQDLATANFSSSSVSVRLGDGAGGFGAAINNGLSVSPFAIAIGDFNGDGKQDFVTANRNSNSVSIRLGQGNGTFNGSSNIVVGSQPYYVTTGDFNGDGKLDFAAANYSSSTISIRLGDGLGGFTVASNVNVGTNPGFVTVGDFNNDGKQDLASAYSNGVSISIGNGTGGFGVPQNLVVGSSPANIAIADFNGDGNQDLAVANYFSNSVSIRIGDGTGNFSGILNIPAGFNPQSVATGDFNGDGKQDFASANYTSNNITVHLGNSSGGFTQSVSVPVGTGPSSLAIADFNGDGYQDFAVANYTGNSISVRLGAANLAEINVMGNNTNIAQGANLPNPANHTDFEIVNSKLIRTFTIQNTGTGNLPINNIAISGLDSIMFTVGGITFPASVPAASSIDFKISFLPTTTGLKTATVTIANNDCDEALYTFVIQGTGVSSTSSVGNYPATIITSVGGNTQVIPSAAPQNAAAITATTSTNFKGLLHVNPVTGIITVTDAYPAGNYVIQVNAYNGFSIANTNFTLSVGNANCSRGLFSASTNLIVGTAPVAIAMGDFNNDGKQDLATGNRITANVSVQLGNGTGGFSDATNIFTGYPITSIEIGDFNGDGNQDFVTGNGTTNSISIGLGDGIGGFNINTITNTESSPESIAVGDFNADGKLDLAIANSNANNVSIYIGNGVGNFNLLSNITVSSAPRTIVVGDFNGDNHQDFATANGLSNNVSVRFGNGTGSFSGTTEIAVGNMPITIAKGDFNNDNKQDFVVTNQSGNNVSVRLGDGVGGFVAAPNVTGITTLFGINVGDFNGDGNQDLIILNNGTNTVSIRLGDGAGNFTGSLNPVVGMNPRSVAIGDFNGDGKQDFATANAGANTVSIIAGIGNEINLQGNTNAILNGDSIPSTADHTDFETTLPGGNNIRTFTIQNLGQVQLVINNITISGADAAMFIKTGFSTADTIAAGSSKSFIVTFAPTSPGLKTAMVNISNDDCDESTYYFVIQGGVVAGTLDFDGINDHIVINDTTGNIGTSDATISAWIKTTAAGTIISKRDVCGPGNFLRFAVTPGGELSAELDGNSNTNQLITGTTLVYDGAWHNVAAVRQGADIKLYVDGLLDASATSSGIANISNTAPLLIGASGCNGASSFFSGQMDELKFYNRALTTCEIQNTMRCEMSGNQTGLLLYYKFNQGRALDDNTTATTLSDSSGNINKGTLTNFALTGSTSNWVAQGAVTTGIVCSDTNSWLGTTAAWNLPSNWSTGFVPLECTKVVINAGVPNMPQITSPVNTCFSLKLNNGATVTVKGSGKLNIVGK